MGAVYINIHTHRRVGVGVEVVSVMAGVDARGAAREAVMGAVGSSSFGGPGSHGGGDLSGTASIETALPAPPFSIGIHPWQLPVLSEQGLEQAMNEVETAPASAIGEIGLDYYAASPGPAALDHQKAIFTAQLLVAARRGLPVILHCVRAFEPVMELLAAHRLPAVVFHGFIGSPEQAARALRAGYFLSFGERSFASPKTVEALRAAPPSRIFLETDDSPLPIAAVYSRAASLLSMPVAGLAAQLHRNYRQAFGG